MYILVLPCYCSSIEINIFTTLKRITDLDEIRVSEKQSIQHLAYLKTNMCHNGKSAATAIDFTVNCMKISMNYGDNNQ